MKPSAYWLWGLLFALLAAALGLVTVASQNYEPVVLASCGCALLGLAASVQVWRHSRRKALAVVAVAPLVLVDLLALADGILRRLLGL